MENSKYVMFCDTIGRLIIGTRIKDTGTELVVKNPTIVHVNTTGTGMNIQFFPIVFREFQADKDSGTIWTYSKSNIAISEEFVLDVRLIAQYEKIYEPLKNLMPIGHNPQQQPQQQQAEPNVIKLFDD